MIKAFQDEALHGRAQLLAPLGGLQLLEELFGCISLLLLGVLLLPLSLLESPAWIAVFILRERLQVLFSSSFISFNNHLGFRQLKILDINRTNYPKRTIDASGEVEYKT